MPAFRPDIRTKTQRHRLHLADRQYLTQTGSAVDKITLIGHSMGGLVSRSYLEWIGPQSKNPQDAKILGMIDQLITLGTPHLGAPLALAPISQTLALTLFQKVLVLVLAEYSKTAPSLDTVKNLIDIIDAVVNSNPSGVSTYQLLPPNLITSSNKQAATFTAFIDDESSGAHYPMYPYTSLPPGLQALLGKTGTLQSNLNAAISMFDSLNYTATPSGIAYNCLYGIVADKDGYRATDIPVYGTTTAYKYTRLGALEPVHTDGGGDLVVPIESAMFVGNSSVTAYPIPGADHISMPSNPDIQTKVNGLLKFAS